MATPSRPLALPETFKGDKKWDQWIVHFENVAEVNDWDDAAKLKWLKVRLIDRAQTAFQRLADAKKDTFAQAKKALRERFEPEDKRERYVAELSSRAKKSNEEWPEYAEDLLNIADKAYTWPSLRSQYLSQLTNPQISFAVKQKRPKTLDEAVAATLEMESFVPPTPKGLVAPVGAEIDETQIPTIAGVAQKQDRVLDLVERLTTRLENLESQVATSGSRQSDSWRPPDHRTQSNRDGDRTRQPVVCHKCKREGQYARETQC